MSIPTNHYLYRDERQAIINSIGAGKTLLTIRNIDRGHPNGLERHVVTSTGVVFIYNERTNKLITTLIARPSQIKRYYLMANKQAPNWLLKVAQSHKMKGYNV